MADATNVFGTAQSVGHNLDLVDHQETAEELRKHI
jgi:hypothetical protein